MTFAELRAELSSRGIKYGLSGYINRANKWLDEYAPWPWLETTTTGVSPLTISDFRQVISVVDVTNQNPLDPTDAAEVNRIDPGAIQTGPPDYYWFDGTSILNVWPTNTTSTLRVRYIKLTPDLVFPTTSPPMPTRYHYNLVDVAELFAHTDARNFDAAQAIQQRVDLAVARMVDNNLGRNLDRSMLIEATAKDF